MNTTSYQADFRMMRILHYALLFGVLAFAGVAYFLAPSVDNANDELYNIFRFLVPGMAAVAILAGRFVSNTIFGKAKDVDTLGDKLEIYRTGMLIRWALVEGVSLFAVVAFLLTGNLVMLLVAMAGVAYMFTLRPTPESVASALSLSETEYRELG